MVIKGDYNSLVIRVDKSLEGKALRDVLRADCSLSSRLVKNAKKSDSILVNNRVVKTSKIVYDGDIITLNMFEKSGIEPENAEINIVYEDIDVLVVNKEAGVLVHPTKNHESGTLLNKLIHYARTKGEEYKPHLVNRLDRDTSGLLIVAKNPYAHYDLMKQMAENSLEKRYLALCKGSFEKISGLIDFKISDKKHDGINRLLAEDGKKAETIYKVLKDDGNLALVDLHLITGRTHQIRVHLNAMNHSLLGDELYGGFGLDILNRQALHAYSLKFQSPRTGRVEVSVNLAEDMKNILENMDDTTCQ